MEKEYEDLQFTDDFIFCKVLSNNLKLCARVISLILGIKVKKVVLAESQKVIEMAADSRGIRLDVYVEDEAQTVFDLEMQTTKKDNIPKRMRYYQGMIDMNIIGRGALFSELKPSCIIFICLDDRLFKKGLPVYTFENTCNELSGLRLGDETRKVIVNAKSKDKSMSEDMRQFLRFLSAGDGDSDLVRELKADVKKALVREEWRAEYMTLNLMLQEKKDEGIQQGIQQGIKKEKAEALKRVAENYMKMDPSLTKKKAIEMAKAILA